MEFDEEQNGDEDQLHPVWTYFNYDSIHDSSKCLSAGPDCKLKDHSMNVSTCLYYFCLEGWTGGRVVRKKQENEKLLGGR